MLIVRIAGKDYPIDEAVSRAHSTASKQDQPGSLIEIAGAVTKVFRQAHKSEQTATALEELAAAARTGDAPTVRRIAKKLERRKKQ